MEDIEGIFCGTSFDSENMPYILVLKDGCFHKIRLLHESFTLTFDDTARFCTGSRDIKTGKRQACPTSEVMTKSYEQCPACSQKTGFNPAFYHATTISPQQQARNNEPHILYLAHFSEGLCKVGISHAARGISRLLEQGARSAIILETFATATAARSYEAKIAQSADIKETLQIAQKIKSLQSPYDEAAAKRELLARVKEVEKDCERTFSHEWRLFDQYYFFGVAPSAIENAVACTSSKIISGSYAAHIGSIIYLQYEDDLLFFALKKYIGARIALTKKIAPLTLPARQISLF